MLTCEQCEVLMLKVFNKIDTADESSASYEHAVGCPECGLLLVGLCIAMSIVQERRQIAANFVGLEP